VGREERKIEKNLEQMEEGSGGKNGGEILQASSAP
jgi:hypothetical protein